MGDFRDQPGRIAEGLGLGLDYGTVALVVTPPAWPAAGRALAVAIADLLGEAAMEVEAIGSTAVEAMLAKPVLDIAIGVAPGSDRAPVIAVLEEAGFVYRGDAGDAGGLVFVYETAPAHRVAHLHVVDHGGVPWMRYLALRDLLRVDPSARARYAEVKVALAGRYADDGRAYTAGKSDIIALLLAEPPPPGRP